MKQSWCLMALFLVGIGLLVSVSVGLAQESHGPI
jgi:hypothetical protein